MVIFVNFDLNINILFFCFSELIYPSIYFLDMILVIYDVYIKVYGDFWLLGW